MTVKALDVAHYVLFKQQNNKFADQEKLFSQERYTPLKMQTLLYYAQGSYLGVYKKPLFAEKIEARALGPVVRAIYSEYKDCGAFPIPLPDKRPPSLEKFNHQEQRLLDTVCAKYGCLSPYTLSSMTHAEDPWRQAWKKGENSEIEVETMKEFFSNKRAQDLKAPIESWTLKVMQDHENLFIALKNA